MWQAAAAAAAVAGAGVLVLVRARTQRARQQAPPVFTAFPEAIALSGEEFTSLLRKLVGEAERVQNFPPEFVPREADVVRHLLNELAPYSTEQGGRLQIEVVEFTPGRQNLIVRLDAKRANPSTKTVTIMGMHLDVVPADRNTWKRDPFALTVEGDLLYGRGTTDCLGHVALVTLLFKQLAVKQVELECNLAAVFIASEENDSIKGVGVDGLARAGKLDFAKNGYVLWVDASDGEPCMGTAGALQWKLTATGKRGHSGFPQNTVNPIELAQNAVQRVQEKFYAMFPPLPAETRYKFATPSTMKPTQMASAPGSLNQIPPTATISGDIRLTPFYDVDVVVDAVDGFVRTINADLSQLENVKELGPSSRFVVKDVPASVTLEWIQKKEDLHNMEGIACNVDSPAFHALVAAVRHVRGSANPYSVNGSLPLVRSMQRQGFDLQITGFGLSKTYHGDNEYCSLSDMLKGGEVLWCVIKLLFP